MMHHQNHTHYVFALSALLSSLPAFAFNLDAYISGGATMPRLVNNANVHVFDDLSNRYVTRRQTDTRGMWGGGAAIRFAVPSTSAFDLSVGVAGYAMDFGTIQGTKYPSANLGDFDPLHYAFKTNSTVGLVEGRFAYTAFAWQPYVVAGLGVAKNTLENYTETPMGTAVPGQLFQRGRLNHSAIEAGFGIKHTLLTDQSGKTIALALDYRYFNTGSGHLGAFDEQTTRDRLRIHHLETDALLFTLNLSL